MRWTASAMIREAMLGISLHGRDAFLKVHRAPCRYQRNHTMTTVYDPHMFNYMWESVIPTDD